MNRLILAEVVVYTICVCVTISMDDSQPQENAVLRESFTARPKSVIDVKRVPPQPQVDPERLLEEAFFEELDLSTTKEMKGYVDDWIDATVVGDIGAFRGDSVSLSRWMKGQLQLNASEAEAMERYLTNYYERVVAFELQHSKTVVHDGEISIAVPRMMPNEAALLSDLETLLGKRRGYVACRAFTRPGHLFGFGGGQSQERLKIRLSTDSSKKVQVQIAMRARNREVITQSWVEGDHLATDGMIKVLGRRYGHLLGKNSVGLTR
ncbi:MAG: hypothetical protein KDN22_27895 [Verrucomicrobiae bacterium]|nr:hypothetical protein [Verrucomicrobiae bacterium]